MYFPVSLTQQMLLRPSSIILSKPKLIPQALFHAKITICDPYVLTYNLIKLIGIVLTLQLRNKRRRKLEG